MKLNSSAQDVDSNYFLFDLAQLESCINIQLTYKLEQC